MSIGQTLYLATVIVAVYVAALVALAVHFWRAGFVPLAVATLVIAAEVTRQIVAAWRGYQELR